MYSFIFLLIVGSQKESLERDLAAHALEKLLDLLRLLRRDALLDDLGGLLNKLLRLQIKRVSKLKCRGAAGVP